MKKFLKCMALTFVVLSLCGCLKRVEQGVIYDKKFTAAYIYNTVRPMYLPKSGGGVRTMYFPTTRSMPDEWRIYVRDEEGNDDSYIVSQSTYDAIEIGKEYRFDKIDGEWIVSEVAG
ncbi:MAG: hypothetical protein IJW30_00525 [Clostridia bacterium]|nr:hypothetical protein [Clostridia bacterium]